MYTYIVNKECKNCIYVYDITIIEDQNEPHSFLVNYEKYNYNGLVDTLISYKYPIDKMQAVINNYLLDPSDNTFVNEFKTMQQWRSDSKEIAKEILRKFPKN